MPFARCARVSIAVALLFNLSVASAASFRVPNDLYGSAPLTFVVGTMGDDASDRIVDSQVSFIRRSLFPQSGVVADTAIVRAGSIDWPEYAIVYGGQHVNRLISLLNACLPLRVDRNSIQIGDLRLDGPEFQLIALVPESDGQCPHPAFLLLAGSGSPGVEEINSIRHGVNQVEIADRFGPWIWGHWEGQGEAVRFMADGQRQRIEWGKEPLRGAESESPGIATTVCYPVIIKPWNDVDGVHKAIARGLAKAGKRLGVDAGAPSVYVYPDPRSMQSLTGKYADAWASIPAQAIHVTIGNQFDVDRVADTIAHEATHLFAFRAAGQPASQLMGEGLAVWVSGQYGGVPLDEHAARLKLEADDLVRVLSIDFRNSPESETYPLAGLLVGQLVGELGLSTVLRDFYGTPPAEWKNGVGERGMFEDQCRLLAAQLKTAP